MYNSLTVYASCSEWHARWLGCIWVWGAVYKLLVYIMNDRLHSESYFWVSTVLTSGWSKSTQLIPKSVCKKIAFYFSHKWTMSARATLEICCCLQWSYLFLLGSNIMKLYFATLFCFTYLNNIVNIFQSGHLYTFHHNNSNWVSWHTSFRTVVSCHCSCGLLWPLITL